MIVVLKMFVLSSFSLTKASSQNGMIKKINVLTDRRIVTTVRFLDGCFGYFVLVADAVLYAVSG